MLDAVLILILEITKKDDSIINRHLLWSEAFFKEKSEVSTKKVDVNPGTSLWEEIKTAIQSR